MRESLVSYSSGLALEDAARRLAARAAGRDRREAARRRAALGGGGHSITSSSTADSDVAARFQRLRAELVEVGDRDLGQSG